MYVSEVAAAAVVRVVLCRCIGVGTTMTLGVQVSKGKQLGVRGAPQTFYLLANLTEGELLFK